MPDNNSHTESESSDLQETKPILLCPICHVDMSDQFLQALNESFTPVLYLRWLGDDKTQRRETFVVKCPNNHIISVDVPGGYIRKPKSE